ncbi:MAG: Ig-like domain-containing protein, partial [Candidatus Thermoplasmatota archaeon]|nr:Ig-like domain-containing protein [Candidatus Thermoplasmatota archaeon]
PNAPPTILNFGPVEAGENLSIEFSNPLMDGVDEVASIMWGIGESPFPTGRPTVLEWSRWTSKLPWSVGGYAQGQWTGDGYVANVSVPDFLPVGTELSIFPSISLLDVAGGGVIGPIRWVTISEENPEPVATIIKPAEDEVVSGTITLQGTAADDIAVEMVEIRIDDGDWIDASGEEEWTFDLDTTEMEHGEHTLRVRSYDGTSYSDENIITFIVDEPPKVEEISLETGETLSGTITLTGETSDDEVVEVVQVRIDDGDWEEVVVNEQGDWNHELVTTDLDHGTHTLVVRVSDGVQWSETMSVEFEVDQVPVVTINDPVTGGTYIDDFFFNGSASDDGEVVLLEVRVDGGEWTSLGSIDRWSDLIPIEDLKNGEHTYEARSFDGVHYSDIDSVTFTVEQDEPRPQTSGNNWLYVSIVMVVAVGIIIGVFYRNQRRS